MESINLASSGTRAVMWIQVRLKMALKDDCSSITVSGTKTVTGAAETGMTIPPSELVYDPLKPTSTLLGFRRLSGLYPRRSKAG